MTRTGLARFVMPACARTVLDRPVPAQIRLCGLVSILLAAWTAHPARPLRRSALFKPTARQRADRWCRPRAARPPLPCQRARVPHAPSPRAAALANRPHSCQIGLTRACSGGVPPRHLDFHVIPEGTSYAYSTQCCDRSGGLEYPGPRQLPAGPFRAIVPRHSGHSRHLLPFHS